MHLPEYYVCIDIKDIIFLYSDTRSCISYSYYILIPNIKCSNIVAKFIRFYLIEITLMVPLEFFHATSCDKLS